MKRAGIEKPFRPFHELRHTALTHEAAAGNPMAYLQARAGHSQSQITERYIHAAQVLFPGAAARGEARRLLHLRTRTGSASGQPATIFGVDTRGGKRSMASAWLEFEAGEHSYAAEDGIRLDGSGFRLRDIRGRAVEYRDERLTRSLISVLNVAGVSYRRAELQEDVFTPGMPLTLVLDPENPKDPNAIGVWDVQRKTQVGWIPASDSARIATRLRSRERLAVFSLWEYRKHGDRCALRVILGPASALAHFPASR